MVAAKSVLKSGDIVIVGEIVNAVNSMIEADFIDYFETGSLDIDATMLK